MELEVSKDAPCRDECAGHAGEDLPVAQVARAAGLWRPCGLLDELAVELISQWFELLARLQDALNDGHGVSHALQMLQRAEHLEGFILQGCVASASWS